MNAVNLPDFNKKLSDNRMLQIVFNADLRCSHLGLSIVAKRLKLDTSDLKIGEFIVFVNTKKTMIKIFAAGNTVAHFKNNDRPINMKILGMIPRFFNGKELKYDEALAEVIKKEIRKE